MSEPRFDVDAAQEQFEAARAAAAGGEEPLPLPVVEELDGDGNPIEDTGGAEDLPPGFKSYEDYVADGGDPEMYVGRKAYEDRYKDIQENKRLRGDVKGLTATVQQTMEAVNDWQAKERTAIRAEVAAELNQAMEDEDPKAAVAAQKKLDNLDSEAAKPPAAQPEHPIIQEFRADNPRIDADSEEFDAEFNADVEAFYRGMWQQLTLNGQRELTDGQIARCLKKATKDALELRDENPNPGRGDDTARGESPRNTRGAGQRTRRTAPRTAAAKAEDFVITNPRNASQAHAAPGIREMIRDKAFAQAKNTGKDDAAAKKFADGEAQRFEESLAR